MKKHSFLSMVSLLLVVCLSLSVVPVTALAEGDSGMSGVEAIMAGVASIEDIYGVLERETVPEIIGYDYAVSKAHVQRLYSAEGDDLNRIVFLNADGTQTAYVFDFPVKYVDASGTVKDITLDIADSSISGQFETAGGSAVTTFSRNVSDGIGLVGNNAELSLVPHIPVAGTGSTKLRSTNSAAVSTAKRIDSRTISYDYDSKTSIEYSLTYTGFKEDIVVSEYTGRTRYDFTLYTNGLQLKEINDSFYLVDGENVIKATLGDIIIFTADEKNNTMGTLSAQTVIEGQEYLLTIVIDPEFLASDKTVYPIRIDPTVEICYDNDGTGAIEDVTINSNSGSSGTSGSLRVGLRETYGKSRILMKFPGLDLSSLGSNIIVTNASVELRDLMCEGTELQVYCYVFTGNTWDESTANWSNVNPDSYSTFLSSNVISYANGVEQPTKHRYSFDITKAVEGWRTGNYNPDKGIIFKAYSSVENGSTYNSKTIASYNRASYKPSLSVTYGTTSNYLSNDTYYFNNRYCGDYLQYASSDVTATSGLMSSLGDSIRWEVRSVEGGYVIRSKADPTKYLAVSSIIANNSVMIATVTDSAIPSRCIWNISAASGSGCLIKNAYNSKYLYANGNTVATESPLGATGTERYESRVWRFVSSSIYGNTSAYSQRELNSGFSVSQIVVDIGETSTPKITLSPNNALWASASDFSYTYSSGTSGSVIFNSKTGEVTGETIGISKYIATHKVTGRTYTFDVYVDRYTYELVDFFGFTSDVSLLIRDLYNRIDDHYSTQSEKYKAWVASRVLSEFTYDGGIIDFGIASIDKWDDVAGSITSPSNRKSYFVETLGYSEAEYNKLNTALSSQHSNTQTSDFTHMQYSLSARLAYRLQKDGVFSNIYTLSGDETVSYLAGWLGDATLTSNGTTSMGNDDYMADLDAENIFRRIDGGEKQVVALNNYYRLLTGQNTRATLFKSYLSYSTVENMILSKLGKTLNQVKESCPDTYDFLMSLKDSLAEIAHY